jgi:hypothetical protein
MSWKYINWKGRRERERQASALYYNMLLIEYFIAGIIQDLLALCYVWWTAERRANSIATIRPAQKAEPNQPNKGNTWGRRSAETFSVPRDYRRHVVCTK